MKNLSEIDPEITQLGDDFTATPNDWSGMGGQFEALRISRFFGELLSAIGVTGHRVLLHVQADLDYFSISAVNPEYVTCPPCLIAPLTTTWRSVKSFLPDDEMTVLIALECGEVWTGYILDEEWHYVSSDKIGEPVLYWADFPEPPTK